MLETLIRAVLDARAAADVTDVANRLLGHAFFAQSHMVIISYIVHKKMIYREHKPAPALSGFIECYWSAKADSPPFQEREALIPDGTIELMFNFGDPYHQCLDQDAKLIKGSHVIGIRRRSLFIAQSSRQDFFSVRFKTGGTFPFFGIPAHLYAQGFHEVDSLLGAEYKELEERLYESKSNSQRIALLDRFFLDKLANAQSSTSVGSRFLQAVDHFPDYTIKALASEMGHGYKRVERHVKASTGLTPRQYLSIRRFNRAVKLMYAGSAGSLTHLALEAGYFDQAHFNRDFKKMTSQAPRDFLKSQFKIVEVIQPALAARLSKTYNF